MRAQEGNLNSSAHRVYSLPIILKKAQQLNLSSVVAFFCSIGTKQASRSAYICIIGAIKMSNFCVTLAIFICGCEAH